MEKVKKEIELAFWKFAIPLMTRSSALRIIIGKGSTLINDKQFTRNLGILLIACCFGFAAGMLAFSIYTIVS